jgi:predicted GNAT family acetyltransferase
MITERKKWPKRKKHVSPKDFFSTNEDKTKLNWFLFEYALQLEILAWYDRGLRERLRGKGIGDKEVAAFCVRYAKHMKAEILDRVSGKTENVRMGYEPIEAYFPTIGDALVDRLLTKAAEAWDSQTEVCVVCPARCISEKEQRATMFDDPCY